MIAVASSEGASLFEARAALSRGFAEARSRRLPVISFAAPEVPVERFLGDAKDTFLLDPFCAAEGTAAELIESGEQRFERLIEGSGRLFAKLDARGPIAPRLVGGFAFHDHVSAREWIGFPAAWFVLPRWTYVPGALIHAGDDAAAALRELDAIWARLASAPPAHPLEDARAVAIETEPALASWTLAVEEAVGAIKRRRASKVVLARSTRLRFDRPLDDRAVVARLARSEEGLRFLIRTSGASFLGSTPERLLAKRGDRVEADALAGTASAQGAGELGSDKILREHRAVVDHVSSRLGAFAVSRDPIAAPAIRPAGTVRHLHTPIRLRARPDAHLFELAAAIHPTPAVCGAPIDWALGAIARTERFARGWYSGAVGWIDAAGDGELYVALRCALLRGERAYLYAGAGIVDGSRAGDEYLETAMKERVMLRALGAVS